MLQRLGEGYANSRSNKHYNGGIRTCKYYSTCGDYYNCMRCPVSRGENHPDVETAKEWIRKSQANAV